MALREHIEQAEPDQQTRFGTTRSVTPVAQTARQSRRLNRGTPIVLALMAVTFVKQLMLVLAYPPFQGHDEVAHLGYLATIANDHRLPTFDDALPAALADYSRYTLDWPALYTANHPPLYYLVSWPVYALAGNDYLHQLFAVRLVSVPLFLLTIWLTYLIARMLFPGNDLAIIAAPAVVAFQPQLGFEGAIVNNDMLAILFGTLLLYLCLRAIFDGLTIKLALVLGLVCGFGLLTKATLMALLPIVAAACAWCRWPRPWVQISERRWWRETLIRALAIIGPTVALAAPWYFYLRDTYGDFTAFEATQDLQRDWNHPAGSFTDLLFSGSFHKERVHETWGYYGWRLIPLDSSQLAIIYIAMVLCGVGMIVGLYRWLRHRRESGWPAIGTFQLKQAVGIVTLAAAAIVMYGAMIYFGTMFLLTQARYFFPILPAAIVLAVAGLGAIVPSHWQRPATVTLVAGAGTFQVLILMKLVLPYAYL